MRLKLLFTTAVVYTAAVFNYTSSAQQLGDCKKIDSYLTQLEKEKNFSGGLLIIKDGIKVFSKGYGWANKEMHIPYTVTTLASMGSITKAFTAAAIMKLCEQGKISIKDSLQKFFSNVPPDKAGITLHQLLTHSSGFHEFLQNDGGDYEKLTKNEFIKRAFAEPLAFKPGEKAVYTNVGMSVLAVIIEQVSAMDYEQYLRKFLFNPAGIKNIGYHYPLLNTDTIAVGYQNGIRWGTVPDHFANAGGGPYWNLKGNGGLEISLEEMYLWVSAIANNTILNATSKQLMFTPHIQEDGYDGQSAFGYGCNILKSRRNTKMIDNGGSNGIYHARLIRLPEEGLVFYMVTNENAINTNMVLPNITQLYFQGDITDDAMLAKAGFENPLSKRIYDLFEKEKITDLAKALEKEKITVEDDMILYEVGQRFMEQKKTDDAFILYRFYTKAFPRIIVAWNDLGDIYQLKNNKEEAIKCYKEALRLRPGNARAQQNLEKLLQ